MVYTCSCCKHIEFREWCRNYFCEINKCYMYSGSRQCPHFELKDVLKEDPFYNPNIARLGLQCYEKNQTLNRGENSENSSR